MTKNYLISQLLCSGLWTQRISFIDNSIILNYKLIPSTMIVFLAGKGYIAHMETLTDEHRVFNTYREILPYLFKELY